MDLNFVITQMGIETENVRAGLETLKKYSGYLPLRHKVETSLKRYQIFRSVYFGEIEDSKIQELDERMSEATRLMESCPIIDGRGMIFGGIR